MNINSCDMTNPIVLLGAAAGILQFGMRTGIGTWALTGLNRILLHAVPVKRDDDLKQPGHQRTGAESMGSVKLMKPMPMSRNTRMSFRRKNRGTPRITRKYRPDKNTIIA